MKEVRQSLPISCNLGESRARVMSIVCETLGGAWPGTTEFQLRIVLSWSSSYSRMASFYLESRLLLGHSCILGLDQWLLCQIRYIVVSFLGCPGALTALILTHLFLTMDDHIVYKGGKIILILPFVLLLGRDPSQTPKEFSKSGMLVGAL